MYETSVLLTIVLCLAMVPSGRAQSTGYADRCVTSVDNATIILPPSIDPSLPDGTSLAPGDTIAVENSEGNCVGYGVWTGDEASLAIAAAGPTGSESQTGLEPGAPLSWTVLDASAGRVVDVGTEVVYASCATIAVPTCQDDGTYTDGAVLVLEAFHSPAYRLTVAGADGTDNDAGWRMLALPAAEATRASLEDDLDFSAMPRSVVRRWQDEQWTVQRSSAPLPRGTGFILYLFDHDANPVDADGLRLDVDRGPEDPTVDQEVTGLDRSEEWVLLGNPFPVPFDLGALADGDLPAAGFQATVHVWDPAAGQYRLITQGTTGDVIPAWQGFFAQRSTIRAGQASLTFGADGQDADSPVSLIGSRSARRPLAVEETGPPDAERPKAAPPVRSAEVVLRLGVTGPEGDTIATDRVTYRIDPRAADGYGPYDAEERPPPSTDGYATATLPILGDGALIHRALAAAPPPAAEAPLDRSIPLSVRGVGTGGTATLSGPARPASRVPADWRVHLVDTRADSTIDLRRGSYAFALGDGRTLSGPSDARFRLQLRSNTPPVELGRIDGESTSDRVSLRWKTTTERTNTGFRVERRAEAPGGEWTRVGFVEGAGTTDEPQRYRFEDADLPYAADTLHYRLRAVQADGTTSLSDPIAVVRTGVDAVTLLDTYPNPASSRVTVRYALPDDRRAGEAARFALYDALGRRVRTAEASGAAGRHEHRLRVSDLASGVYVLRLRFGGTVQSRKLTVVH
jgi:hypothetical protein